MRQGGVGAPRGPGYCAQMPAPGLERLGVDRPKKKKRSGFRPRSSGRGLALHLHFTLDQTPAEERAEAQNRRREERRARAAMLGWAQAGPQRACECVH